MLIIGLGVIRMTIMWIKGMPKIVIILTIHLWVPTFYIIGTDLCDKPFKKNCHQNLTVEISHVNRWTLIEISNYEFGAWCSFKHQFMSVDCSHMHAEINDRSTELHGLQLEQ